MYISVVQGAIVVIVMFLQFCFGIMWIQVYEVQPVAGQNNGQDFPVIWLRILPLPSQSGRDIFSPRRGEMFIDRGAKISVFPFKGAE